jgi:OOP family OmpA-OmpF porin
MRVFICVIAIAAVMATGSAFADASAGQGYVSVMGTYTDDDAQRAVDDGFNGGMFSLGKAMNQNWNFEVLYATSRADSSIGSFSYTTIGADVQRVFMRDNRFSPYVHAGVGAFRVEPPGADTESGGAISAGLGFYIDLFSSSTALRVEWKYREDKAQGISFGDNLYSIGIQIPFGGDPAPVVVAAAVDGDGDGDGVKDSMDQCPDTAAGVAVDSVGCALDSDGDGVADGMDQCPNTPAGAAVDATGCELDSDGDGVVDSVDECPGTPPGVQVGVRGCEIKEEIVLHGVNFESNSDRLVAGAESVLDQVVGGLKKNPTIKIEIGGHTDSVGSDAANESLSARRAQTVHDYLATNGIAVDRMTVRGYGETQPIADNETAAGKAENRRVVLRITER